MKEVMGVIGGSGVSSLDVLSNSRSVRLNTPFGAPSDEITTGDLQGVPVAFIRRHGPGHCLLPSEINFRANIYALKMLGVRRIYSLSAVGSLREELRPGEFVIPSQFFDRTHGRNDTFFGDGIVAHVSLADPVCGQLGDALETACVQNQVKAHRGGTYLCIAGPQFSTRAESNVYRAWGMDVIGMTNVQEAKLAREAGICYATLAMVTDYDCWRAGESVTVDQAVAVLRQNACNAARVIVSAIGLQRERTCQCSRALASALMTDRASLDPVRSEIVRVLSS